MTPEDVLAEIGEEPVARLLAVAASDPDAIAVDDGVRRLTYGEFAARVRRIASSLRRELGEHADPVALLLEHDARAPLGLLGILAAGKVPVPIDAEVPSARHAEILARSGAVSVLHTAATAEGAIAIAGVRRAFDLEAIAREGDLVDPPAIAADSPAYVLHTSGSTGLPRGVWQDRRGLMRDVAGFIAAASIRPSDRLSGVYSFAVNGALRDLYGALMTGARLEMRSLRREGVDAMRSLLRGGLTICHCVPPVLRAWRRAAESEGDRFEALRLLYVAGDRLDASDLVGIDRVIPKARVLTGLGSTEIATLAFEWMLDPATLGEVDLKRPLPVGRPSPGRRIRLLGADGEPLPEDAIDVVGELEVESDHLARGIWNDPDATERTVRDFGGGRRAFRSGDLLSRLADGRFVHHGRADAQVKIDGHRVEAAETELALRALGRVRDAAVLVRRHPTGECELEAHVVAAEHETTSSSDLVGAIAEELRRRLPAPFVPTRWRIHDALPTGPNLKVDRAALARIGCEELERSEPPANELERTIAAVWGSATGTGIAIGRSTRWRRCGGDSMHAIAVAIELARRVGRVVRGGDLADDPTLAELAALIHDRPIANESSDAALAGSFPLLPTQAMLWRLRRQRGSAAASTTWAIELEGALDPARLAAAWRRVVEHHDGLRLRIIDEAGELLSCADGPGPEWIEASCSRESAFERLRALAASPADLRVGRTGHVLLANVAPERWIFGIHLDHVVSDFVGRAALLHDLGAAYAGGEIVPPLPIGEACRRIAVEFAESYPRVVAAWRDRIRSWPEEMAESTAGVRSVLGEGERIESILAAAARLAGTLGVAPFAVELAAIAAAMFAETGTEAFAIGVPSSLRDEAVLARPFGCLIATAPVLLQPGRWRTFLEGVREADRELEHGRRDRRQSPAAISEAWLAEGRTGPMWTTLVSRLDGPEPIPTLPGVQARAIPLPESSDVAPTSIVLTPGPQPTLRIRSDRATLDPTRLLERIGTVLARNARDPSSGLTVVSEREERTIRRSGHPSDAPRASALLRGLLGRLEADSDRTVLIDESMRPWSARSLLAASETVADRLAAVGIEAGMSVALRIGRSAAVLPAMLGIWMRGGVAVPVEPRLPPRRARRLCEIASVVAALDDQVPSRADGVRRPDWLPGGIEAIELEPFEVLASAVRASAGSRVVVEPARDAEAVVLFTSGSTGEPKGVPIRSDALAHFLEGFAAAMNLGSATRSVWLSSIGFDVSLSELLLGLWTGGSVAIRDAAAGEDPSGMLPWADRAGATLLFAVPSVWRLALPSQTTSRRAMTAVSTGEPIDAALATKLAGAFAVAFNGYGPTETNFCSLERLQPDAIVDADPARPITVPIGCPLPGMTMRVLSTGGTPLPPGTPGELAIGGVTCMRGYRRSAEALLGRETLVRDPLDEVDWMHRSGDRGVLRSDGRFECLGRLDGQVKVAGVRAELGEVEAVLHSVAGVRDVAVVQVAEQGALAAFVVATPGSDLDVDRLRGACEESLHPSVVPTRFKVCDVLPRSVNGKVDRRRLAEEAAAEATRGSSERAFEGSDLEEIARCMGDAIGRGPLGADEDFFAVGGDSLASIRLSIELERRFHRPVFPADLLKGRSPRMLAMLMHSRLDRERDTPILSLRDGLPGSERASTLVLVPGLGGSPLSFVPLARLLASGRRVFGATLPDGSADSAEISIESIAARAVEALPSAPCVHFVGYSMGVRIAFEAARRVTARGGRATLIVLDAAASLSGSGPRQWMRTAWAAARGRLRAAIADSPESPTSPVGGARARIRRSATIVRAAARRHVYEPSEIPMALLVSASTSGRRWSAADGEWSQVARLMMREVIPGDHLSIVAGDAIGTTAAAIDRAIEVLEREPARP